MKKIIAFIIASSPALAFAQQLNNINDVATKATNIGNLIIQLAIALSVVWIIISIVRYFVAGGEDERKAGGWRVFYGVLALFLILSIWGLVNLLRNSFTFGRTDVPRTEINNINLPPPPSVPN